MILLSSCSYITPPLVFSDVRYNVMSVTHFAGGEYISTLTKIILETSLVSITDIKNLDGKFTHPVFIVVGDNHRIRPFVDVNWVSLIVASFLIFL